MNNIVIAAVGTATESEVNAARLGSRFGRMDLTSRLALVAVESLRVNFDEFRRDRVGICLAARAGSLATDVEYWDGRDVPGGPSPTLFAYTLPSAAIGEIAIRHGLTGPNLCLVGEKTGLLREAVEMIRRGEVEACLCVECEVITPAVAALTGLEPAVRAWAVLVRFGDGGSGLRAWSEKDSDIETLCAVLCVRKAVA